MCGVRKAAARSFKWLIFRPIYVNSASVLASQYWQCNKAPSNLAKGLSNGQRLVDEFDASLIILGCAGMAAIKEAAQKKLPVPVIEPAQAAVRLAIAAV